MKRNNQPGLTPEMMEEAARLIREEYFSLQDALVEATGKDDALSTVLSTSLYWTLFDALHREVKTHEMGQLLWVLRENHKIAIMRSNGIRRLP